MRERPVPRSTAERTAPARAEPAVDVHPAPREGAGAGAHAAIMSGLRLGAGNAQIGRLIAGATPARTAGPVLQRKRRSKDAERKAAAELGAPDAFELVAQRQPALLAHLSREQLDGIQTVVDAAAINPGVRERYRDAERKATKVYGEISVRDERLGRQADRIYDEFVLTDAGDKRIQLDAKRLFTEDLFAPETDNPDEAAYLDAIRQRLEERGVWLLIGDGVNPEIWLSLGPEPDGSKTIPTPLGLLTQKGLLATGMYGAGFYEHVHQGPVARSFQKEADHIFNEIQSGRSEHFMRERDRDDAFFGVTEISDWLGDADWPSKDIWDPPFEALMAAYDLRNAGKWTEATATLVASGRLLKAAANCLHTAAEASIEGAETAVKWLRRVKTAAEITETVLIAWTGVGVLAGGSRVAATATASEIDALAEATLKRYVARNPALAEEVSVQVVKGPPGTVSRGVPMPRGYGGFQEF